MCPIKRNQQKLKYFAKYDWWASDFERSDHFFVGTRPYPALLNGNGIQNSHTYLKPLVALIRVVALLLVPLLLFEAGTCWNV